MRIHRALWNPYGKGQSVFIACLISSQRKDNTGKKQQNLMFPCCKEYFCQVTFTAEFWDVSLSTWLPKAFIALGFSSVNQRENANADHVYESEKKGSP